MASKFSFISSDNSVVDPDLGGGGGGGGPRFFVACPASFSALCDSFLQSEGGPGPLPLIHHCNPVMFKAIGKTLNPRSYQPMISKYYPPNR